jgi:hypothetical protein
LIGGIKIGADRSWQEQPDFYEEECVELDVTPSNK